MEGKGRFIIINNKRVFYAEHGGKGKTMLLLHGWSGSHENFNRWLPVFKGKYRVIIPDLPGCGMSEPLNKRHTLEAYAEFLEEFVKKLGLDKFILGGLFTGAALALEYAGRNRKRITALLLHTPAYAPRVVTRLVRSQAMLGSLPGIHKIVGKARKNYRVASLYKKIMIEGFGVNKEDFRINMKNLRSSNYEASMEFLLDILNHDYTYIISTFTIPIYIIMPDRDRLVNGNEIVNLSKIGRNVTVRVLEGAGHGWSDALIRKQNRILSELF